jgi:asparagine synthetase B (glutamine-hydrolysing)
MSSCPVCTLQGDFSIMVYDSNCGYFLAARSSCGTHPLYWGTEEGNEEVAIVSTKKDGLADFPPGCLFEVSPSPGGFQIVWFINTGLVLPLPEFESTDCC